eukprot:GHVS01025621.1.p1 GENE.GHVS01025621.1~~GHVS01025621.1.p1  ORF type:complete len:174 (+),score=62.39 GHVS01025621.1:26-523(+)
MQFVESILGWHNRLTSLCALIAVNLFYALLFVFDKTLLSVSCYVGLLFLSVGLLFRVTTEQKHSAKTTGGGGGGEAGALAGAGGKTGGGGIGGGNNNHNLRLHHHHPAAPPPPVVAATPPPPPPPLVVVVVAVVSWLLYGVATTIVWRFSVMNPCRTPSCASMNG